MSPEQFWDCTWDELEARSKRWELEIQRREAIPAYTAALLRNVYGKKDETAKSPADFMSIKPGDSEPKEISKEEMERRAAFSQARFAAFAQRWNQKVMGKT